ncbi:MAG: putative inosine/xanthosine triphosphatase [Parcubacteria group bacterium Gr01-1014_48]|nr:MAG: putative inosine/xanthosine triphosphatase [Parcubacteria group bacterium Greene0416_14]TSC71847.1 MAG: putative inosine/xanthosine triphosphatase [Parcubacteria group bacterium Gr01-1014_48]TSC99871.1 MAG: putative inosine/xanthosine triphosphatase [Parcubacteria group bacterium Greene1014_15]TSD06684.1 MAG: putative inosine/xanthosine triphosphatase [Parcubacteria group bacterium Greene0714_4]
MKKIIVASKNPVKIRAAIAGFEKMFPDERLSVAGCVVSSGVGEQPKTDVETLQGAYTRALNALKHTFNADYSVGIEGGIEEKNGEVEAFAWVVVMERDGGIGKGKTGIFFLPPQVTALIREGKELGEADDIVFGRSNSKQENGAVGILTNNVIDRTKYYTDAVVFALIPFKNRKLYYPREISIVEKVLITK